MNILITGAAGFVGKNLTAALEAIRDGKDRTHPGLEIGELYLYDINSPAALLEEACEKADFVFNLAGVNRPQNQSEFMEGNYNQLRFYQDAEMTNVKFNPEMTIDFGKNELKQKQFYCCHAKDNPASGKVMTKVGFQYQQDGAYFSWNQERTFESKEYILIVE